MSQDSAVDGFSRLGRVLEKKRVAGRVGALKYTIVYFVQFFYSRLFPGFPGYFQAILDILDIISFFGVSFFSNIY